MIDFHKLIPLPEIRPRLVRASNEAHWAFSEAIKTLRQRREAPPMGQRKARKLTEKQAIIIAIAEEFCPDRKVRDTMTTAAITEAVNEKLKDRGSRLRVTDKTVATALDREPRRISRRRRNRRA